MRALKVAVYASLTNLQALRQTLILMDIPRFHHRVTSCLRI